MKTIEQIIKEKIAPHLKELRKRSKKESWKNGMPFFDHNFEQMKFENGFALIPLEIIRDPKTNVNDIAVYQYQCFMHTVGEDRILELIPQRTQQLN